MQEFILGVNPLMSLILKSIFYVIFEYSDYFLLAFSDAVFLIDQLKAFLQYFSIGYTATQFSWIVHERNGTPGMY